MSRHAQPWWRRVSLLALVGLLVALSGIGLAAELTTTKTQVNAVTAQRDTAVVQKVGLADTIAAACTAGTIPPQYAAACTQAAQVKATPLPAAIPGPSGRGVAGVAIVAGHLVIAYTDGTTTDVGQVVGANGKPGAAGAAGATGVPGIPGIAGVNGTNGRDGLTGAPGRGIDNTAIVNGHLMIFYSDGTSQDVGQVVGPTGPPGSVAVAPSTAVTTPPTAPVSVTANPTG